MRNASSKIIGTTLTIVVLIFVGYQLRQNAHEGDTMGNPDDELWNDSEYAFTDGLPVFPGAVGFGTDTRAGRGGKVLEVTNLEDNGEDEPLEGSFRKAILTPGPRIIVFKVGGTIRLKAPLYIRDPYVTIAGQTAPGDGIALRDFSVEILTHDILMQNIRVRPGNEGNVAGDANDGINFLGKRFGGDIYNVVIDHVSVSWAEDENISMLGGLKDVTISNSIISEGLNASRHGKKTHSTGLYIGDISTFSAVGNLLAHNNFRNPVILNNYDHVSMLGEIVNNVIYDWQDLATEITDYTEKDGGYIRVNIVGNTYKKGPSTKSDWPIVIGQEGFPRIFAKDNNAEYFTNKISSQQIAEHNLASGEYLIIGGNDVAVNKTVTETKIKAPRFATPAVEKALSADNAYEVVLSSAGATKPRRDAVDARIVAEVRTLKGRLIDDPEDDVGGYPFLQSGIAPTDSDHDGMSDEWEQAHTLDPKNPKDGRLDRDGDGYTNVEEYLFSLL